jgi:hypothetical protein
MLKATPMTMLARGSGRSNRQASSPAAIRHCGPWGDVAIQAEQRQNGFAANRESEWFEVDLGPKKLSDV